MKLALKGLKRHHVLVNQIIIFCCCEMELAAVQFKLNEMTIIEYVQKLFDLETRIGEKIGSWKQEITLKNTKRNSVLKNSRKLDVDEYWRFIFVCLERFESHYLFFRLKPRFFNFCESFIPDFGNFHSLHLNESEDDVVRKNISRIMVQLNYVTRIKVPSIISYMWKIMRQKCWVIDCNEIF